MTMIFTVIWTMKTHCAVSRPHVFSVSSCPLVPCNSISPWSAGLHRDLTSISWQTEVSSPPQPSQYLSSSPRSSCRWTANFDCPQHTRLLQSHTWQKMHLNIYYYSLNIVKKMRNFVGHWQLYYRVNFTTLVGGSNFDQQHLQVGLWVVSVYR